MSDFTVKYNLENTSSEPIAIVGIGCRFPGASDPQAFWQLLRNGRDAISEIPRNRWNTDYYYDPEPGTPGKMYSCRGGFIEYVDRFDPDFFGISPREAERIDPQQRLLLEVVWEALENSGIAPHSLSGSDTGVIVGCGNYDYGLLLLGRKTSSINAYDGTGGAIGLTANRLSYTLNLRGPSLTLETSCSSSLVAIHLACESLRRRESSLCLVGAVSLMLAPQQTIIYSQARMMSADGRCKTFDANADGYVRGEGCGVVVLKRLSDAVSNGDNIRAIIRGSAINQDGLSNGITAPNGPAQQAVINQALENAGVAPSEISYVEAHGTGTSLGDPIEARSLKAVLMRGRTLEQPCYIGSVKTNVGHLEAAAGMAGLIKVILSMKHREIPPHLNLRELNPLISFQNTPFSIPTKLQCWDARTDSLLAGISSFGFGGTNAHVVLEEAPGNENNLLGTQLVLPKEEETLERPLLLTLSAKSDRSLQELASKYVGFLRDNSETLADICFTANTGRSHFEHRLAVVTQSSQQLKEQLEAFARGRETSGLRSGFLTKRRPPKIAMLFTGQGSQYVGMGAELYATQPTFKQTLERCAAILEAQLERPLLEILFEPSSSCLIDQTQYTQPAIFALEYALYSLWQSWGVAPEVVMGHSVGEYVAATVAGVWSLEDGLKLIASRGRLMQKLPEAGSMLAVMASEAQLSEAIKADSAEVAIAAINGAESTVISGREEKIASLDNYLKQRGIKTKPLQVSHGFHSPLMKPMLAEFAAVAREITYAEPKQKIISNLTGKAASTAIATPEYWVNHVIEPVRFAEGMKSLEAEKVQVFLEIGARPILLGMGRRCLVEESSQIWLPSLRPEKSDWQQMLESLSELYLQGVKINWQGGEKDHSLTRVELPTYPFQRQRYWADFDNSSANNNNGNNRQRETSITQLLDSGDIKQLSAQITTNNKLSEPELQSLPKLLEILVAQHQQQLVKETVRDLFYEVDWLPQSLEAKTVKFDRPSNWLILADKQGVGEALAELLQKHQQECILVYAKEAESENSNAINPCDPQAFKRLCQNLQSPLKVVYLWSLDFPYGNKLDVNNLERSQLLGCGGILHLLQALLAEQSLTSSKLWSITQNAVAIDSDSLAITQAPLWGLGKVIALEHPELWGGTIDLAPQCSVRQQAETLLNEIVRESASEQQVAFRDGRRYVSRLKAAQPLTTRTLSINPDATYLITGGFGAIAQNVAQWLIERGAKYLVLTSRSQVSESRAEAIADLEEKGAKVIFVRADVSRESDLSALLSKIKFSLPPLKGIFHTAGEIADGVLQQQDWQSFARVMSAKVSGAWILHSLTQELPLDYFVAFSSVSALLGSPGQGNYAAANTFLDALAHYRQGLGLPGLSINWGAWEKAGMAASLSERDRARIAAKGIELISPQLGLQALEFLLATEMAQVGVMQIDWDKFIQQFPQGTIPSFLANFEPQLPQTRVEPTLLEQLETATISDRKTKISDRIRSQIALSMGLDAAQIDTKTGFSDLGMDSLMAVELRNYLQTNLECALPASLAFDYPTVEALTDRLLQTVLTDDSASVELLSQQKVNETVESSLDSLDDISDEEAEAMLLGKLDSMSY